MKNIKQESYKRGLRAEHVTALYLRLKGYKILKMRYKTAVGEIDIVARRRKQLVMVEVKLRGTKAEALESVTPRTRRRIARAALHFISAYPAYNGWDIRFDVIYFSTVAGWLWPFSLSHLDNAWQVSP